MGTFLRSLPLLEHSGSGKITINNFDARREYIVARAGDPQTALPGTSVTDGVADVAGNYGDDLVISLKANGKYTLFARRAVTYTPKTTTTCTDNCGLAYQCPGFGDGVGCRPCWGYGDDGYPTSGGVVCCGGSRGQTCNTTTVNVKDPVPAGFTERYGEWVQIYNPETRKKVEGKDTGLFTISNVEWPEDYYQAVEMPTPHKAQVIDEETGGPTGEFLDDVPAWDYDSVHFIHYNPEGDVVWAMDQINNPECFTIVQKEPMKRYEMWVSNLPPADAGTYEFVISNPNEELVRVEGNV